MLKLSNIDVLETLREFRLRGLKVAFVVPTPTGLDKSIMDATEEIRRYLADSGVHDYEDQPQGTDHKHLVATTLLSGVSEIETKTSLYRPVTKTGDPRLWIYELKNYASPGDLIALLANGQQLIAINCSSVDLKKLFDFGLLYASGPSPSIREESKSQPSAIRIGFPSAITSSSHTYRELLGMLRSIASKGFVRTLRVGDTGVGYTLETLLGIRANSSRAPDFHGIEIKAGRARTHRSGQATVFSKVPDWSISRLKGSKEILAERGRFNPEKNRRQLFHEISAEAPNSYGLQLEIDYPSSLMHQIYNADDHRQRDVSWAIEVLKGQLLEKHKESVWVTAQSKGRSGEEEFWYNKIKHTDNPDPEALPLLLELGAITVHYTITEKPNGSVKDQGYLFKTSPKNLDLLFSRVEEVDLINPATAQASL